MKHDSYYKIKGDTTIFFFSCEGQLEQLIMGRPDGSRDRHWAQDCSFKCGMYQ